MISVSLRRGLIWARRLALPLTVAVALGAYVVAVPTGWLYASTASYRKSVSDVPSEPVGIVMGAGLDAQGRPTPFLVGRLDLAVDLYRRGKVKVLLVTGDNGSTHYDEPTAMRNYLVGRGIPEQRIVEDYAGFDTWNSCIRAKKIFGVDRATVITQTFHLPRAVALCRAAGIKAFGVANDTWHMDRQVTAYGYFREVFASLKATDTLLLKPDPRFLGHKETGIQRALGS